MTLKSRPSCLAVIMAALSAPVLLSGCGGSGPPMATATGRITMAGKPVAGAIVMFVPASGQPGDGFTDADGRYAIASRGKAGVVLGAAKVTVVKPSGGAEAASQGSTPEDLQRISEKPAKPEPAKSAIPEKYARAETTDLSAVVTADAARNVFDFDLSP